MDTLKCTQKESEHIRQLLSWKSVLSNITGSTSLATVLVSLHRTQSQDEHIKQLLDNKTVLSTIRTYEDFFYLFAHIAWYLKKVRCLSDEYLLIRVASFFPGLFVLPLAGDMKIKKIYATFRPKPSDKLFESLWTLLYTVENRAVLNIVLHDPSSLGHQILFGHYSVFTRSREIKKAQDSYLRLLEGQIPRPSTREVLHKVAIVFGDSAPIAGAGAGAGRGPHSP